MTNEEIANEIKTKRTEISRILKEIKELKKGFVYEWKVGDRYETSEGQFLISSINHGDDGRFSTSRVQVRKIKKDGTPYANEQYPYKFHEAKRI